MLKNIGTLSFNPRIPNCQITPDDKQSRCSLSLRNFYFLYLRCSFLNSSENVVNKYNAISPLLCSTPHYNNTSEYSRGLKKCCYYSQQKSSSVLTVIVVLCYCDFVCIDSFACMEERLKNLSQRVSEVLPSEFSLASQLLFNSVQKKSLKLISCLFWHQQYIFISMLLFYSSPQTKVNNK